MAPFWGSETGPKLGCIDYSELIKLPIGESMLRIVVILKPNLSHFETIGPLFGQVSDPENGAISGVLRIWQSKTGKYRRSHPIFGPVSYPQNGAISGCFANLTVKNIEIFEKPCFLTKNERGWPTFLNSGDPVFDSQINKNSSDGSIWGSETGPKLGCLDCSELIKLPIGESMLRIVVILKPNLSHFELGDKY